MGNVEDDYREMREIFEAFQKFSQTESDELMDEKQQFIDRYNRVLPRTTQGGVQYLDWFIAGDKVVFLEFTVEVKEND